jgi:transketolase
MQMLPGFTVINPCDFNQTKLATLAIADYEGPVYLRFGRPKWPNFTPLNEKFEIGKAIKMQEGNDVTIIATGHMVWKSMEATKALEEKGISVELINIHTIKPLDESAVIESVSKTKCVVIAEEHQRLGGLGATVSQLLSQKFPCPAEFVAVNDSFGESGTPDQLLTKYGLDAVNIVDAVQKVIARKNA